MKAPPLIVQKLCQRLKFWEIYLKGHIQGHKVINLGVIWKDFINISLYLSRFKRYGQVKKN